MEKLKFILFSIITLSLLGLIGYWSIVTLQSGTEYKTTKKISELQKDNEDLKAQVKKLADEVGTLQSKAEEPAPVPAKELEGIVAYEYQNLINEIQKLINSKVFLKLKSSGSSVGTVQRFLNIYNNTSNKVDNDYGASTKTAVSAFQKAQGLTADGEAGPGTFGKMIDWLKKQG